MFRVFIFGVMGTAVCGCVFGLLTYVDNTLLFLGISYILRYFTEMEEGEVMNNHPPFLLSPLSLDPYFWVAI